MIIKVCGITNIEQFDWLDEHGIELIGLNFYPQSKRFVNQPLAITKLQAHAKKVGVFVNPGLTYLLEKVDEHDLTMVQLHGDESAEFCDKIAARDLKIIKAFGVDEKFSFANTEPFLNYVDYFLFDTKTFGYGGSGQKFNWKILSEYQFDKEFLLSGGIQLEDIPQIIDLQFLRLAGIDVNSGFEISPGKKDLDKIYTMLKMIDNYES